MVVEQHVLAAAPRIPCDTIQSLFHRLPANSLKIGGCLMSFGCKYLYILYLIIHYLIEDISL